MKFTRSNHPSRRRTSHRRYSPYSSAYIAQRREELFILLAKAKDQEERDALIKAFDASVHPYQPDHSIPHRR